MKRTEIKVGETYAASKSRNWSAENDADKVTVISPDWRQRRSYGHPSAQRVEFQGETLTVQVAGMPASAKPTHVLVQRTGWDGEGVRYDLVAYREIKMPWSEYEAEAAKAAAVKEENQQRQAAAAERHIAAVIAQQQALQALGFEVKNYTLPDGQVYAYGGDVTFEKHPGRSVRMSTETLQRLLDLAAKGAGL
jgi:hypothetical protein